MTPFRHRSILATIVLAAFLGAMPGDAGERVLCVGDDGHVSIEAASRGVCGVIRMPVPAGASSAGHMPALTSCQTHCGPCADLPVLSHRDMTSMSPPSSRVSHEHTATMTMPSHRPFPIARDAWKRVATGPPDGKDTTRAAIRSTVLLI